MPVLSQSFPARLSFLLILMTSAVFIIAFVFYYQSARNQVKKEAVHQAERALETTILRIDQVLQSVEVAVNNMSWKVDDYLDNPDYMYELTNQVLKNNPFIVGSAVAFEPYFFPEKGKQFSPYSCYVDDIVLQLQLGTENYDYHYIDWYQIPKLLKQPYWSEPYFDDGGGEMIMSTYSKPLYDKEGKLYAIFTADISLEWFTQLVNSIEHYPNAYNVMIGRGGTYLVHQNPEYILTETLLSATLDMEDRTIEEIAEAMINREKGMRMLEMNGIPCYAFYAPIERTGWSVGILCPQEEIFAGVDSMKIKVSIVFILGILVMLVLSYQIVRKLTRPLIEFTASAQKIAEGNFNTTLPDIRSKDEMKMLRDSFDFMQHSLIAYTEELKRTTANKERIDSELRIASDIQMGMIPKKFPPFPEREDIDLYATLIPAKEVGGDLYDFFIDEDRLYFTVGDVSGKGVPSSLLMAMTRSLFRNIATHLKSPEVILRSLNDSIAESNETGMFVTLFLGIIDLKSGKMEYCNAGHNAPVVYYRGSAAFLEVHPNIPLGLFEGFEFKKQEIQLASDTQILVYTDGVTEAESTTQELFSEERLLALFDKGKQTKTPKEIVEEILDEVHIHSIGAEQSDDITLLCIQYRPPKQEIVIRNEIQELSKVAKFIEELGDELALTSDMVFNLNLVLEEAISNIILYAYRNETGKEITIKAEYNGKSVSFTIIDTGEPFDPTKAKKADITLSAEERPVGGLGIFLIKQIMNEVEYRRIDGQNVFTLRKDLN